VGIFPGHKQEEDRMIVLLRYTTVIAALMILALPRLFAQPSGSQKSFAKIRAVLEAPDFESVKDTVIEMALVDILDRASWTESESYVLGSQILEKDPTCFMGSYLRGWYLSHVATDKMGNRRALEELLDADANWDIQRYKPFRGNLDALLVEQNDAGVSQRERTYSYLLTYYYLQLQYELSSVYLDLDMPEESYGLMKKLSDSGYEADFFSLTRMAWICYKYRDAAQSRGLSFLMPEGKANIAEAIRLAKSQQDEIASYLQRKTTMTRYWVDNSTVTWYEHAANNIISISYGVGWETDSAITYYEKMPEWFKLRLNGIYLYLTDMNYRAAERQFEYIGKAGNSPVSHLAEPQVLELYKNVLIYKGDLDEAHFYLKDYAKKYQSWRGMGLLWEGTVEYWRGNLDEAEDILKSAYDYPEVFGNTSLTRQHYDIQIHIQLSAVHKAKLHRLNFQPVLEAKWYTRIWHTVKNFFLKLYHWFMSFLHEYWAVDSYLQIIDRDEYLKIFYTENPTDYFQTWSILKKLNPDWHLKRIETTRKSDERVRAGKFYDLMKAGYYIEQEKEDEARALLAGADLAAKADTAYEKLFIAMVEDMAVNVAANSNDAESHLLNLYRYYPQAVFLWGHTLPITMRFEPLAALYPEELKDYYSDVQDVFSQFEFDFKEAAPKVPSIIVQPEVKDGRMTINYVVTFDGQIRNKGSIVTSVKGNGKETVAAGKAAKELAYSIFHIGINTQEKKHADSIARGS
jgi:hypothetical protein